MNMNFFNQLWNQSTPEFHVFYGILIIGFFGFAAICFVLNCVLERIKDRKGD